jgi:hypothetical protein
MTESEQLKLCKQWLTEKGAPLLEDPGWLELGTDFCDELRELLDKLDIDYEDSDEEDDDEPEELGS